MTSASCMTDSMRLYERQQRAEIMQQEAERKAKASRAKATEIISGFAGSNAEKGRVAMGVNPTHMDYDAFREFLAGKLSQKVLRAKLTTPQASLNGPSRTRRRHQRNPTLLKVTPTLAVA
jgi:hypothetical protein